MKLEIDKSALEYIKEKGGIMHIDAYTSKSCCIEITEANVDFSKPKMVERFDMHVIDDVTIYVRKSMDIRDEGLKIKLNNFLGIKNISVSGVQVIDLSPKYNKEA